MVKIIQIFLDEYVDENFENTMEMGNDNGKRNENKLKKEIIQRIHLRSFLVTNCFEILLGVPRSYEYFEP